MMVNNNMAYATWRWNQRFSSRGRNRTFGRTALTIVRQTGRRMSVPSIARTRPAPLESQTDHFNVFSGANLTSWSCFHLHRLSALRATKEQELDEIAYHPNAKRPKWSPQNKTWKMILLPVSCFFNKVPKFMPPAILSIIREKKSKYKIKMSTCDSRKIGLPKLAPTNNKFSRSE